MAGLVPAIYVFELALLEWMPGTRPDAMQFAKN
jgi:hypothetical protein